MSLFQTETEDPERVDRMSRKSRDVASPLTRTLSSSAAALCHHDSHFGVPMYHSSKASPCFSFHAPSERAHRSTTHGTCFLLRSAVLLCSMAAACAYSSPVCFTHYFSEKPMLLQTPRGQHSCVQQPWQGLLDKSTTHAIQIPKFAFYHTWPALTVAQLGVSREEESKNERPQLFLKDLPVGLDEEGLKDLLRPFGEVQWAKLVLDVSTGMSKCNAFARFGGWDMAKHALAALNGTRVCTIAEDGAANVCSTVLVETATDSDGVLSERLSSKLADIKRQIELERRGVLGYGDGNDGSHHSISPSLLEGSVMQLFQESDAAHTDDASFSRHLLRDVSHEGEGSGEMTRVGRLRVQKRPAQRSHSRVGYARGVQQNREETRRLVARVGSITSLGKSFCIVDEDIYCSKGLFPRDRVLSIGEAVSVDALWRVRGRNKWLATRMDLVPVQQEAPRKRSSTPWNRRRKWQGSSAGASGSGNAFASGGAWTRRLHEDREDDEGDVTGDWISRMREKIMGKGKLSEGEQVSDGHKDGDPLN